MPVIARRAFRRQPRDKPVAISFGPFVAGGVERGFSPMSPATGSRSWPDAHLAVTSVDMACRISLDMPKLARIDRAGDRRIESRRVDKVPSDTREPARYYRIATTARVRNGPGRPSL